MAGVMNYNTMTENYAKCLEKGLQFQDFILQLFMEELGVPISNFSSKKYQYSIGENVQGIEIKFDDRYKETRNIYIETKEKSNPNNLKYIDSGIYRSDNTWLYVIGNYNEVFIFGKTHLILMHKRGVYKKVKTKTSIGFLLPKSEAERYCLKKIIIN